MPQHGNQIVREREREREPLLFNPVYLSPYCSIQGRPLRRPSRGRLLLLPLVGRLALCAPGVDPRDLVLQSRVDEAVALQTVLADELGRYDECSEGLAAAT